MKLNYSAIEHNISVYNKAKELIPAISQYERGEITSSGMRSVQLGSFADFYDFISYQNKLEFSLTQPEMTWRKLKLLIINHTKDTRLKKYIYNRTQKDFISLLGDAEKYDKLLHGRWLRKPTYTRRGRLTSGRRSDINCEGLNECIVPIINFAIQNEIELFDSKKVSSSITIPSFIKVQRTNFIKWYTEKTLNLDSIPQREIEVTDKLIRNFVNILEDSKIDMRKLNLDYVINAINERLKKGMKVNDGTNLKCLTDIFDENNRKIFSKDQFYKCGGSYVSNGSLMVYLQNDLARSVYTKYNNFEDMSIHRDNLLDSLFG